MGLLLKISAEELVKSFATFDKTGNYSKDNPGGWGGPNPRIQDITSSILQIEGPLTGPSPNFDPQQAILNTPPGSNAYVNPPANGIVGQLQPLSAKINLTGNFPNKMDYGYEIIPPMIGTISTTKITSGKWTLLWTVSGVDIKGNAFSTQTMLIVVFIKDVTCCVDKQTQNLHRSSFEDHKHRAIIELGVLLYVACKAIKCGKYDDANNTIQYLNQNCICLTC